MNQPLTIVEFPDNHLAAALFGEHDKHLAQIETSLGVEIIPRGNRVQISGPKSARKTAKRIMHDLYTRLESDLEVGMGEVKGALSMAEAPWTDQVESCTPEMNDGDAIGDEGTHGSVLASDTMIRTKRRVITPRTPGQAAYIKALHSHELVFGVGPAGTGKTYVAVAMAAQKLMDGKVDRIILSRPAVEAGERLGFLPGDMRDKVDPYLRPLYDALYDMMPGDQVAKRLESGEIEVAPLAFMRGRTLSNAYVILDEAQNCTTTQMKMFLTRLGENSHMIVTGDPSQVDLPLGSQSGLVQATDTLSDVKGVAVVRFTNKDVVRHPLVTRIVNAYDGTEDKLIKNK
ncbi:MAG: PhoH family protein [Alphaproteobacteria bacterium]